ncbi:MAG: hypothetical protein VB140_09805, partial [Burkholderia sp.]
STAWRTSLVRNPFVSPEIIDPKFVINMPVDAMASSRLIYATTPTLHAIYRLEKGLYWQMSGR